MTHEDTFRDRPELRKMRILLVDDDEDAVHSLARLLASLGHEVRAATSGKEALAVGRDFLPDVVLLDLGMPDMDGFETQRAVRATPWGESTRIMALTGWGQPEDIERTKAAGFAGHLVKPLKITALAWILGQP
jgi:CheY-like chemotaxis protein